METSKKANGLLRYAREERGWTQRRLADEIGVGEQTVRSWERGSRFPSLEFRSRLCHIFEKSPAELGLLRIQEPISEHGDARPFQSQSDVEITPHNTEQLHLREPTDTYHCLGDNVTTAHPAVAAMAKERPSRLLRGNKNRQRMLNRVHARWIAGAFNHLSTAPRILLELQMIPSMIARPWQWEDQDIPSPLLPTGTGITDVYDEAGGELLILGEPGAGKSTLLVELTRELINRAMLDETHQIPVIFNLSSWTRRQSLLTEWLIEELNGKYQIPTQLARTWITTDQVLLLLDGLDEVSQDHRLACVAAINQYRQEHGLVSMVICSRTADYLALPTRIVLGNAVLLQPLTTQQIQTYLAAGGEDLAAMRIALQHDTALQEMASTPLMLSVLRVVYQGMPVVEPVLVVDEGPTRRHAIFEHYIERMLKRRGPQQHYTLAQTTRWLTYLATQLSRQSQTEFSIEHMQPDWLPDTQTRERYRNTVTRLIYGIHTCIYAGLFACFRGDSAPSKPGLFFWLGGGRGNTLLGWMALGLGGGLQGAGSLGIITSVLTVLIALMINMRTIPALSMKSSWTGLRYGLRNGILIGGIIGVLSSLIFGLSSGLGNGLYRGSGTGIFAALLIFLMTSLTSILKNRQSDLEDPHGQRLRKQVERQRISGRILTSFILGVSGTFGFVCMYALQADEIYLAIKYGIILGLFEGLFFAIGSSTKFIPGLGTTIAPAETIAWSWDAVRQELGENIKKGARVGFFVLLGAVIVLTCTGSFFYGWRYGVRYGLLYGIIVCLVASVTGILTGVITSGWSSDVLADRQQLHPNEGILRSARNAAFAAFLFGPIGGVVSGIASGIAFACVGELTGWFILGAGLTILFSVIFVLQILTAYGGCAVVEHYVLRWYLWRYGYMPLNYIRFLDYASEHLLLRKVGGGYIFFHRLLLDHFANIQD